MFKRNIFPRRPQANSGKGKYTTGTSTSEAKAFESRKAGRGSPGRVPGLVAKPGPESRRRAGGAACGKPGRRLLLPSAWSRGPQREAALPRSRDRRGGSRELVGAGVALRRRSLRRLGARGPAGSASCPVRSGAPSAKRSPTLPG